MTKDTFRVGGIDHVELSVPDRFEAAEWYNTVLGLEIVEEFEHWADLSAYPLMISSDGGDTMLALFKGRPSGSGGGVSRVAFRTTGEDFLTFMDRLESIPDINASGESDIIDFGRAYSVFFTDTYGHVFEVTTYESRWARLLDQSTILQKRNLANTLARLYRI